MKTITSTVAGYEGICTPTWLNTNRVLNRLDGGVTGFFKLTRRRFGLYWKTGEEFHGILSNGVVQDDPRHTVRCDG